MAHIIYKYIRQLEQQRSVSAKDKLEQQNSVSDKDKHSIAQTMSRLLKQIHQRRDYASHDLMVNERSTPARDALLEDLYYFLCHELA